MRLTLCNNGVTGRHLCRDEDSQSPLEKESPPLRKRRVKRLGGGRKETHWEGGRERESERMSCDAIKLLDQAKPEASCQLHEPIQS